MTGLALLLLICVGLIALRFAPSRRPVNEPEYQGRYLSEWLSDPRVSEPDVEFADKTGLEAVRTIGTNGLPYYLDWLQYEPGPLRLSLVPQLPRWVLRINTASNWTNPPAIWRAHYGYRGIQILGTNAASAIPGLAVLLNQTNKPYTSQRALGALCFIGPQAITVLKAALADTNHPERWKIASTLRHLGNNGLSNACLPILAESLYDQDAEVREQATQALEKWAPQLRTNAPAR